MLFARAKQVIEAQTVGKVAGMQDCVNERWENLLKVVHSHIGQCEISSGCNAVVQERLPSNNECLSSMKVRCVFSCVVLETEISRFDTGFENTIERHP